MPSQTVFYAVAGGLIPSLLWLWFWLREDDLHPEPKRILIETFVAGMLAVLIVIPFQFYFRERIANTILFIVIAAGIEELAKFFAAYATGLRSRANDEPIDPIIYLLTAALGFAAVENFLFLFKPIQAGDILLTLKTGNLRFMGATLLHIVSSTAIGISIGVAYFRSIRVRRLYLVGGLVLSMVLHALYNLFIMGASGGRVFLGFYGVWVAILAVLLMFEKIKTLKREVTAAPEPGLTTQIQYGKK